MVVMLASLVLAVTLPATASPSVGLSTLAGTWNCTYRAGAVRMPYVAAYTYDRDDGTLREVASFAGGGDEGLFGYDAHRRRWTEIVLDAGTATILSGTGSDPNHVAYRSIYPDASIAERFDRVSVTEYTLTATVRSGGKTTSSVDTCLRTAP